MARPWHASHRAAPAQGWQYCVHNGAALSAAWLFACLQALLGSPGCRTSRRWPSQTRRLDRRSPSGGTRRGSSAPRSSCSAPWCEAAACPLAPNRPCRSRCRRHRSITLAAATSAPGLRVLPRALACWLVPQSLKEVRCVAPALARPSRWARRPCPQPKRAGKASLLGKSQRAGVPRNQEPWRGCCLVNSSKCVGIQSKIFEERQVRSTLGSKAFGKGLFATACGTAPCHHPLAQCTGRCAHRPRAER